MHLEKKYKTNQCFEATSSISENLKFESEHLSLQDIKNEISNNTEDSYELVLLFIAMKAQIDNVLDFAYMNDLGMPLKPLEVEVQKMIELAQIGEVVKPPYNRKEWDNPLSYLEKQYGKYLKYFGAPENTLYLDQLGKIDQTFKSALKSHILRKQEIVSDYIPTKSERIAIELKYFMEKINENDVRMVNKINALKSKVFVLPTN
ncbi:MAG: hypothetical protein V7784_21740 [Oceanospirillaceae bacterium]